MTRRIENKDWKLSALVYFHIQLDKEEIINIEDICIRIFRPEDILIQDAFIIEIYKISEEQDDIVEIYHELVYQLNKFLDRMALSTLNPCTILQILGITRFKVKENEQFQLLLPESEIIPQPKLKLKVNISELINNSKNYAEAELYDALREFRQGIESNSLYYQFLHYYNSIERIAELLTTDYVYKECNNCKVLIKQEIKATGNKMAEIFESEGISKKDFKTIRNIRGKIAHGSGMRDKKLSNEIFTNIPKVFKVAGNQISKHTDVKIIYGKIPILGEQFWLLTMVKLSKKNEYQNSAFNLVSHSLSANFIFTKLNDIDDNTELEEFKPLFGSPTNLNPENFSIYPYCFPY